MAYYSIDSEIFLGFHCNGCGEYTFGDGSVELSDEEVDALVALIRENNGETDIEALGLKEKYPEIHEALDDACRDLTLEAEYKYWLLNGYDNNYYDEPAGFMERLEADGLFKYEPDIDQDEELDEEELEERKEEAFYEWLDDYYVELDDDDKVEFIEKYYGDNLVDLTTSDLQYDVIIPQEIIDMAKE